jgi:hypothetical protein
MTFESSSIRVATISPEDEYGGQRVTLIARLGPGTENLSGEWAPYSQWTGRPSRGIDHVGLGPRVR